MILKAIVSIIVITFFYYKPFYLTISLLLFLNEYFYFWNYVFSYFEAKKKINYKVFKIDYVNPNTLSNLELWEKICKINAYKRLYIILLKKKINIKSIIVALIAIGIGVPIKMLLILKYFFLAKCSLREALTRLLFINFHEIEKLKIEINGKKTYLNCSSREIIVRYLLKSDFTKSNTSITNTFAAISDLRRNVDGGRKIAYERLTTMSLGFLETEEGHKLTRAHYSNEKIISLSGESVKTILHSTSNVPKLLDFSQKSAIAIPGFIRPGAQNPGSIITTGNYKFVKVPMAERFIYKWKLDYVYYSVFTHTLDEDISTVYGFAAHEKQLYDILGHKVDNLFVQELMSGRHDFVLINTPLDTLDAVITSIRNSNFNE